MQRSCWEGNSNRFRNRFLRSVDKTNRVFQVKTTGSLWGCNLSSTKAPKRGWSYCVFLVRIYLVSLVSLHSFHLPPFTTHSPPQAHRPHTANRAVASVQCFGNRISWLFRGQNWLGISSFIQFNITENTQVSSSRLDLLLIIWDYDFDRTMVF